MPHYDRWEKQTSVQFNTGPKMVVYICPGVLAIFCSILSVQNRVNKLLTFIIDIQIFSWALIVNTLPQTCQVCDKITLKIKRLHFIHDFFGCSSRVSLLNSRQKNLYHKFFCCSIQTSYHNLS